MSNKNLMSQVTWLLVVIGALNWGIIGLGILGNTANLNVVNMLVGNSPTLEAVIYILVGLAGARILFKGNKCTDCFR